MVGRGVQGPWGRAVERQLQVHHKDGNAFPITMRMQADKAGGVEAKIQSLNDVMGVLTIDDVGAIRNSNEYVAQMFGYSMVGGCPGRGGLGARAPGPVRAGVLGRGRSLNPQPFECAWFHLLQPTRDAPLSSVGFNAVTGM